MVEGAPTLFSLHSPELPLGSADCREGEVGGSAPLTQFTGWPVKNQAHQVSPVSATFANQVSANEPVRGIRNVRVPWHLFCVVNFYELYSALSDVLILEWLKWDPPNVFELQLLSVPANITTL